MTFPNHWHQRFTQRNLSSVNLIIFIDVRLASHFFSVLIFISICWRNVRQHSLGPRCPFLHLTTVHANCECFTICGMLSRVLCEEHTNSTSKSHLIKYSWNHKPWLLITSTFAQNLITHAFSIAHWHWPWMHESTTCSAVARKDRKQGKRHVDAWHWLFNLCNTSFCGFIKKRRMEQMIFLHFYRLFSFLKWLFSSIQTFIYRKEVKFFMGILARSHFHCQIFISLMRHLLLRPFFALQNLWQKMQQKRLFLKIKFLWNSESFPNFASSSVLLHKKHREKEKALPHAIMNMRRIPFQCSAVQFVCAFVADANF